MRGAARILALVLVVVVLLCAPTPVLARGHGGGGHGGGGHGGGGHGFHGGVHHHHFSHFGGGVVIGGPWWDPWWYYPPYYYPPYYYPPYYPPPVVATEPPVYIQRPPEGYWYYCSNPQGYYPSVQSCAEPWIRVAPSTP